MWVECLDEVKKCKVCLLYNIERGGFHPMRTLVAKFPMDHVVMDFAGPFPVGNGGEVYILILVDVHTRFCFLRVMKGKTARKTACACMEVFANFGVPKLLQSDNDTSFANKVVEEFSKLAGFEHRRIMAYFPRTNGVVEKWVGETKNLLYKWLEEDFEKWGDVVPAIQMSLNDRISSRTKSRPFDVMFGRRMNGFEDYRSNENVVALSREEQAKAEKEWIEKLDLLANDIWPLISRVGEEVGFKRNARGNLSAKKKPKNSKLEVGQLVLRKVIPGKHVEKKKWEGPYEIVEFDKKKEGYKLKEVLGRQRLIKNLCPIERLKECTDAFSAEEEDGVRYEVDKLTSHGEAEDGSMMYRVKWTGYKKLTWEPGSMLENRTIQDYWISKGKTFGYAMQMAKRA